MPHRLILDQSSAVKLGKSTRRHNDKILWQLKRFLQRSRISGSGDSQRSAMLVPGSWFIPWFLVHPASKTHWATQFLQLLLSSAASSTSSQLMPNYRQILRPRAAMLVITINLTTLHYVNLCHGIKSKLSTVMCLKRNPKIPMMPMDSRTRPSSREVAIRIDGMWSLHFAFHTAR